MSRLCSRLVFCVFAVLVPTIASAADKLPKDGAWARYYALHKGADGRERTIHTTFRFVGTVVEDGKKLRYLEWTEAIEIDGEDGKKRTYKSVQKFLLPEKSLLKSSRPLLTFVRGWSGEEGKTPRLLGTSQRERESASIAGINLLFLPGAMTFTKPTRTPRTIDYQKGQLRTNTGRTGTHEAVVHAITAPLVYTWKTDYELWQHKDVPLGMASIRMKMTFVLRDQNGKKTLRDLGTIEYWVEAWGTGAKSAFPNAK